MMSLRNAFLATALAVAPFAFAGQTAEASTVTGSVTYATEAGIWATRDDTGAWTVVVDGSFSATGGLSSYLDDADDWQLDGMLHIAGIGKVEETEIWGSPTSAAALMFANLPYSSNLLFTLFANAMALGEQALGGDLDGDYTFGGGWGLLPAGDMVAWEFSNLMNNSTGIGPGEVEVTGDFVFTLSGSDVDASVASATEFLLGVPLTLPACCLPSGVLPLKMTLTLTPLSTTPHPIPLPAALPLLAGGVALFGLMGWRRRRA
jgi:hypothetical protein